VTTGSPNERPSAITLLGIAIAASSITCLLLVCLNALALTVPVEDIRRALRRDFDQRPEVFEASNSFNDCLLMAMTIDRMVDPWVAVISPNRLYGADVTSHRQDICAGLRSLAFTGAIDPTTHVSVPYHQYWSGMRSILAPMLPVIGVGGVRIMLRSAWLVSFGIALILALIGFAASRKVPAASHPQVGGVLVILLCFALFAQARSKSVSFTAAPTDILLLLFIACSIAWHRRSSWRRRHAALGALGALVAYFELLHGAFPLFVAATFFLAAPRSIPRQRIVAALADAMAPAVSFAAGLATAMAVRVALVTVLADSSFVAEFFDLLLYRMTGDDREYDAAMLERFPETTVSLYDVAWGFYQKAGLIAGGNDFLGVLLMGFAILVHVVALPAALWTRQPEVRGRLLVLLASSGFVVLFWVVFMEHTSIHQHMTMRLWFWPIAMAILMLASMRRMVPVFSSRADSSFP
jgi:hypothetical protein